MNKAAKDLRDEVARLRETLAAKECELQRHIFNCAHNWSPTEAAHIYHKGYTIPGDPPGTMGVDWRGPIDVPSRTEKRWKRTCSHCGEVQYTTKTREEVTEHPVF